MLLFLLSMLSGLLGSFGFCRVLMPAVELLLCMCLSSYAQFKVYLRHVYKWHVSVHPFVCLFV